MLLPISGKKAAAAEAHSGKAAGKAPRTAARHRKAG